MEKEYLVAIYESVKQGIVYEGGPNFLDGRRTCPHCKEDMHRTPLNQPFVKVTGGKILVNKTFDTMAKAKSFAKSWMKKN